MEVDLLTFARDAAARGDDLYTILAIDALASPSDIRRAFRKKALTAHPDKTGDAYDPVYYRRLELTRDVLVDDDARKLYDDGMRAVYEKRQRLNQMDAHRRRLVEELEAAENAAKRAKQQPQRDERDPEVEARLANGRKIAEEKRRLKREAEERDRERERIKRETDSVKEKERERTAGAATSPALKGQAPNANPAADAQGADDYDEKIADLERRLREKQQAKAEKRARKAKGGAKDPSPPPHDSPRTEADGFKQPSETTTAEPVLSAPPSTPADTSKGRFASTMARLRAAQAEKRRREEEAAKASAGPADA